MNKCQHSPLTIEHFHAVDAATCKQTLAESVIEHSIEMGGGFIVHHGTRSGAPVVVVENSNRLPDQLSAVWYDESQY